MKKFKIEIIAVIIMVISLILSIISGGFKSLTDIISFLLVGVVIIFGAFFMFGGKILPSIKEFKDMLKVFSERANRQQNIPLGLNIRQIVMLAAALFMLVLSLSSFFVNNINGQSPIDRYNSDSKGMNDFLSGLLSFNCQKSMSGIQTLAGGLASDIMLALFVIILFIVVFFIVTALRKRSNKNDTYKYKGKEDDDDDEQ